MHHPLLSDGPRCRIATSLSDKSASSLSTNLPASRAPASTVSAQCRGKSSYRPDPAARMTAINIAKWIKKGYRNERVR